MAGRTILPIHLSDQPGRDNYATLYVKDDGKVYLRYELESPTAMIRVNDANAITSTMFAASVYGSSACPVGASSSAGSSLSLARADHVHALASGFLTSAMLNAAIYGVVSSDVSFTGVGSAATLSRSDHSHGIPSGHLTWGMLHNALLGTTTQPVGTSSGGSASAISRSDHSHEFPAGIVTTSKFATTVYGLTASNIGTNTVGSAATLSRSDHVHDIPANFLTNAQVHASAAIADTKINRPIIIVRNSSGSAQTSASGETQILFPNEVVQAGSLFSLESGAGGGHRVKATEAGIYQVHAIAHVTGSANSGSTYELRLKTNEVTTVATDHRESVVTGSQTITLQCVTTLQLLANDTVALYLFHTSGSSQTLGQSVQSPSLALSRVG